MILASSHFYIKSHFLIFYLVTESLNMKLTCFNIVTTYEDLNVTCESNHTSQDIADAEIQNMEVALTK